MGYPPMVMATSLLRYFERKGILFQTYPHLNESSLSKLCFEMGIEPHQIAVPVLLRSHRKASLMAVIPLDHELDFNRITALLRREFEYLDDTSISHWFVDVEPGAEPPFPEPYELPCIVERSLLELPRIFFRAGSHSCLASVDLDTFQQLMSAYPKAVISNPLPILESSGECQVGNIPAHRIRQTLEKVHRMPAMPAMALNIIQLLNTPNTTAVELAEAVELDPSMAAQIIRYASSPYYGYRGRLVSVQDAITRVLGFDLVSHIALGIASTRAFSVPHDGPLGMKAFWKHALYCAVVCQSLARKIGKPDQVNPVTAYLCGLLHNVGVLLMGHLYPAEFSALNLFAAQHPAMPLHTMEKDCGEQGAAHSVMTLGHDQIGGYLMEQWRLPDAVVIAGYQHHNAQYDGEHADYVYLVQLSNRLLAQRQIGDLGIPDTASEQFGAGLISLTAAEAVFEKVMEMCPEIDSLAEHIAA